MTNIVKSDFHAALDTLEKMAKAQGATQLYHTSSDSDPGSHAGTSTTDYQNDDDGIDENGTDYSGVKKSLAAKVEKSQALTPAEVAIVKGQNASALIADKVSKGQALTPAEAWAVKKGFPYAEVQKGTSKPGTAGTPGEAKDASSVPETNAGDNNDGDNEEQAKKSLGGAIAQSKELRKGLEMSAILAEFARAMGSALEGTEARVAQSVTKSITAAMSQVFDRVAALETQVNKSFANQGEFNKGFADTLVGIGNHLAGSAEVAAAQASQPVAAPKSNFRNVQAVEKSFGPGGLPNGRDAMNKAQITETMLDLVKSNRLASLDLIKFETTGEISPAVQAMVLAHVGQGN